MAIHFLRGCSAAALCMFSAQAAWAELKAQDVWNDWRDYMSSAGYDVSGTEAMSGGTLTVSDITLTLPIPDEDASVAIVLPSVSMTENGDGTVDIDFPSPMPIRFDVSGGADKSASGELVMTHSGSYMKVSGDPANMTYDHGAATTEFTLANIVADGESIPADLAQVKVSMTDSKGTTKMTRGDVRGYDQTYTVASVAYDFAFKDPDSGDNGSFRGGLQGLTMSGTGSIPKDMDPTNMAAMLQAGLDVDAGVTFSGGNSTIEGTGDGQEFKAQTSSQGGGFAVAMNKDQLSYEISGKGNSITAEGAELPFPVTVELAESLFKLAIPVSKADSPQDFAFALTLGNFTMSDLIWGIFDPAGTLPRDPATIALDLTGKVKLLLDIMDPAAAETMAMSPVPPGEVHAVNIGNLLVQAVGAKLTGAGAFTFDNSDMQTIPGMPRPEGSIDLALDGANALIDNLIAMGILSDQDAMPARMMMGMFAVPGDGPDSLKSKIEINAQGHIMANGQRIK